MSLAFSAALLQGFQPALVGPSQGNGQTLWKKIIARVAGRPLDLVGLAAEADDIVSEDNFSFCQRKIVDGTSSSSAGGASGSAGEGLELGA